MRRPVRGVLVGLATLAVVLAACVWPLLARGEAWLSAKWLVPIWVVAPVGLLAVGWVVWRMTLGADARVPRLALPTLAPLIGVVAGGSGLTLHGKQPGDDAHAFERDAVADFLGRTGEAG